MYMVLCTLPNISVVENGVTFFGPP